MTVSNFGAYQYVIYFQGLTGVLPTLAEIALRVQRCRQVDAVLQVAGAGLSSLGLHFVVARLEGR
ncbi:MAG TPA: hypothetical protein P5061_11825, partial [Mycobacterium sp.]|nr:hypothetical protein [Mycobacterium sp.]